MDLSVDDSTFEEILLTIDSDFRFQIFYFFALFQKVTTEITMHYKSKKTIRTTNYINHEM